MGQLLTFRPEVGGGLTGASKTGTTVSYVYDAQGRKLRRTVTAGSGSTDRDYIDGIEYQDGTIDFVHTSEGIARRSGSSYSYEYILRDHLGNNRYVFDIFSGSLRKLQQDDYYPFGLNKKAFVSGTNLNYLYNGKELQEELGQYDYGARFYDPVIGRWNVVDPLAEDAPTWSPYNAMWNNPIKFVDPDGRWAVDHIDVTKNDDGTYKVVGGQANSDKNIYVVDGGGKRTGEVVGQMLTEYSFHDEKGNAVVGANINLNDQSGQNFFNNEIKNVGLFEYMGNARGGELYDFKTRGIDDRPDAMTRDQYTYRGMSFDGKVASARDIGNYAAGYVAGKHGFGWGASRLAFDALESYQKGGLSTEGQPTQRAQRAGHNVGYPIFQQRQSEREWKKATNPWPTGPKW